MKPKPILPPNWIEKILYRFLDNELLESVIGDITEKFFIRSASGSIFKAKLFYVLEGLGLLRLTVYRREKKAQTINPIDMWRNYILVAFRNLKREKMYSTLNVLGLAVGIASVLVIYQYLQFELSYDKFHTHSKQIYRLTEEFEDDALRIKSAMSHAPVAPILYEKISGIKNVVRMYPFSAFISVEDQTKYREDLFLFVDSLFFDMFSFQVMEGSLEHAIDNPFSVVLTEKMALKYFGTTDVVGLELFFEDETKKYTYNITAVIQDVPQNSHFNFNFISSFASLEKFMPWYSNWHYPPMYVYLSSEPGTPTDLLQANLESAFKEHVPDYVKEENRVFSLQPMEDIHLNSNLEFEWEANSNAKYVQLFTLLSGFILLLACINFMNLATTQSFKRSREIGVRKTFGGNKSQLIWQFMNETLVYVVFSFVLALLLSEFALRFLLNDIIQKNISVLSFLSGSNLIIIGALMATVALLSGLYPSIYLSQLKPSQIEKGSSGPGRKSNLRRGLVIFQFVVSSLLICATIIISLQIDYFKNKNLGFDKDHIITVKLNDRFAQKNYTTLKDQLLGESTVLNVCLSSALPGQGMYHGFEAIPEGLTADTGVRIKTLGVDEDFLKTYDIQVKQGRDFSKDIPTDQTEAFILNQAAATKFGWTDPIDKDFELTIYISGAKKRKGKVIGLIDDFNFQSLHSQVEPLVLYINKHPYYAEFLSVRLQPGSLSHSVAVIQNNWKSFHPDKPLEYEFLNQKLDYLYQTEAKMSYIFTALTLIAVVISSLGLFALSSYSASKRAKEMSIRKVFGANISTILSLHLREYVYIILAANVIIIPLCWYWANTWLNGFAYHISLSPLVFIVTLLSSLLMALATVSFHSLKLARQNPIDTIRHE